MLEDIEKNQSKKQMCLYSLKRDCKLSLSIHMEKTHVLYIPRLKLRLGWPVVA